MKSEFTTIQCVFENCIVKLDGYQGVYWVLANGLEMCSPGKYKYSQNKDPLQNQKSAWGQLFILSKDSHLEVLGGSDTAVWASLKSNILWAIFPLYQSCKNTCFLHLTLPRVIWDKSMVKYEKITENSCARCH